MSDKELIREFLESAAIYKKFQEYLEDNNIEESEAESIIDEVLE